MLYNKKEKKEARDPKTNIKKRLKKKKKKRKIWNK